MKKNLTILVVLIGMTVQLHAQLEPEAGNWKTWFIVSGQAVRPAAPSTYKQEIAQVISIQKNLDSASMQQIIFWNAGAPGYRWRRSLANCGCMIRHIQEPWPICWLA